MGEDGATSYTIVGFAASCFQDNRSIRSIVFPPGLEEIPARCFQSCQGLTNAPLPATLVSIGLNAFSGCSSLTGDIVLPDAVEEVNGVWHGTKITSFTAGAGLLAIGASSFQDMSSITNLDLSPAVSLRSIGSGCFQSARYMACDLSGAGLPRTLETIGQSAFYGSSKVTGDVTLPETVTNLPNQVFGNTGIASVTAKGVRSIGERCFKSAGSLARIELGWNLAALLGTECLDGASSLRAVYWRSPPDPAKCTGEAPLGTWDWRANGCTNYIPWSPRTQTAAQPWVDFADEYNRGYGEIVLPTRRYGVGTLRRTGKSATEYIAYWLPDLDPVTILILR